MQGVNLIFGLVILIMSVVVHEMSHGYAAYFLGDPTAKLAGRLTINPLKHLDLFGSLILPALTWMLGGFIVGWAKPVPYNPYNLRAGRAGPALVAAAGPAANLFLALIFSGLVRLAAGGAFAVSPAVADLMASIVVINIVLALFNLLPIPPLDGSKLMFSLLPYQWHEVEEWLVRYQIVLVLVLVFFLWPYLSGLVFWLFRLLTGLAV